MSHDFRGFPGTKRYVPVRLLGVGGMGAVYEVEDRSTGGRVALKVMLADDARRLLRFKQEFRVIAELHHPNLVRLFDLAQHEGRWFFTMELVHGQDLLEVLLPEAASLEATATMAVSAGASAEPSGVVAVGLERRIACDVDAFTLVVAQILDALEFLHGRGIVHRDLKPSNILVDVGGAVRLLDFGLASRVDRAEAISQEGAIVGTLAYLSPEQYRGEPASAASDLYALGCMMFQLLTGDLPFRGAPVTALAARCDGPPPRVDERVAGAPPALTAIVQRLMAVAPAERPSLAEVRAALGVAPGQRSIRPAPAAPDTTAEIFVGRQQELSLLAGCLERAAEGQAQLALVSGPSGIGKSALAARVVERAARMGFLCFGGRCYEREQVPFVAFDRLMDTVTLTLQRWPAAHLASLRPSLRVLARIFPGLGILTGEEGGAPPSPGADPRELHQQAVDGFRQLVAYCQGQAPLCLVLDDLQWADEESFALLSALLAGNAGRLLVLGLFRSDGVRAGHPLGRVLRDAEASGRSTALTLAALGSAEVVRLVEAVTGSRLEPAVSAALANQTEGNPFLVRRLADHLANLAPEERTAHLDAAGSSGDLIREMIRALGARPRNVLEVAATAGGDVPAALLREVCGLAGEELDLAMGELMAARLLKAVPGEPAPGGAEAAAHVDLYHDRIREVVYQGLDDERRRSLHRGLAVALEARHGGRGRDAETLLQHWTAAGDRDRRRRFALVAAEEVATKLAFLPAARLFQIALVDPEPGEDPLVTAARWERVGELCEYGGALADAASAYQQALALWEAAPEGHPERAATRIRLHGRAGANLMATGRIAEGRAAFERGLGLLGLPLERPLHERLPVLAALRVQNEIAARLPALVSPVSRALRRAGAPDARLAAGVSFLDLAVTALTPLWPLPAVEAALRMERDGRRIDDKAILQRALAFGAAAPVFLGRCSPAELVRAHAQLDQAEALARAHDLPLGREIVQQNRALVWLASNMERARRVADASLAGFARRGMSASLGGDVARSYHLWVLIVRGDDDDALAAIERQLGFARANFFAVAVALSIKTRILSFRGLSAEAGEVARRLRAQLAGAPPSRLDVIARLADANVLLAEGRFEAVLAEAEPLAREARAAGSWAVGLDRSVWLECEIEAGIGLLRRGGLSPRARRRARASATWMVERGVFDSACLGHRALAYLEHAEGRARASARALQRALTHSSINTSPRHRWLCLEAARDLGALTLDQETEAAELLGHGRFAWPPGWRD